MPQHAHSTTRPDADPQSLHLRFHPDRVLRTKAEPVGEVTDNVREVAARMVEIMRQEEGIGLAAPQVGLSWRMFVCAIPADRSSGSLPDHIQEHTGGEPWACIDPVLRPVGDLESIEEGCLSLPDIRGQVNRQHAVVMEATGLDGKKFEVQAVGLLARCIQHEVDHLDGVLIIDKFGQLDRLRTRSAVRKLERKAR
ncbi:MAG: peptide deformylase [Phycisphaerales bacterium]|jgi:peptide deformylase